MAVDTNAIQLNYAREAMPAVKPATGWRTLEPNADGLQFGAAVTTTPREPISDKLQRRKGTPTDLDSTTAFTVDATVDSLWDWLEAAVFAKSVNAGVRALPVTAVTNTEYTVAVAPASNVAKLLVGTLIWARNFSDAVNNGLKRVSAADNASVSVPNLLAAAGAGTRGYISLAGARLVGKVGGQWRWDGNTKRATLTFGAHGLTNARGLYLGQIVHFGSIENVGDAQENGLGPTATAVYGFARLVQRTVGTLVFDRVDEALQAQADIPLTDGAVSHDLLFGDFLRNVPRSHADYVQQSHTIEQVSPGLEDSAGAILATDQAEYAVGQVIGTLALNFQLTDKVTMAASFVGQDTESPVDSGQLYVGTPAAPVQTEAFNTSADFARLRVIDEDEEGLTTDFKSLTLTINPQTSPEKVLGVLGAKFINRGNLLVDTEAQVIFTSPAVLAAIRDNKTVRFECIIGNTEGVFAFEVPSQTLGGGGREYPVNQKVLVNTTGQSFEDADFETSIHVSFIPVPVA